MTSPVHGQARGRSKSAGPGLAYVRDLPHPASAALALQTLAPPFFSFQAVKVAVLNELMAVPLPPTKLISITAPTGYGKTVLLSSLYAHYQSAGAQCCWLALDDRDVSVGRVLTQLESALVAPVGDVNPLQALHQGDESPDERISAVLDSLALIAGPAVVFVDNLNYCLDETLAALNDALIFRTPPNIYFVLASTSDQPFNRARAKLEGCLRQIGFAELSLSEGETAELLGPVLCSRISIDAVRAIVRQTEGWPAAVRLMQIILTAADDPEKALTSFTGADEDLAALLNHQVLQGFDAASRQFLLEISLLRTFGVNLSRHATGDEGAAEHIRWLLQQNVFVIPLDRNRSWYRLHALFREFLMDEAERQIPLLRRQQILARAAEWCEHGGYWQDAIDYALAADSVPLASAILERVAAMFVRDRGDLHQYIEWVERLHAVSGYGGWETDFWYVWALVFHRRYEYARQQLNILSNRLESDSQTAMTEMELTAYRRRLVVIRLAINIYTDSAEDANRDAMLWLAGIENDDPFNVATVASAATLYRTGMYELVDAHKMIRVAQSAIVQAQSDYGVGWVSLINGTISLHEGDFAAAHQDLLATLARARQSMGDATGIASTIALLAAKSAVEMTLDTEARELLILGLRRAPTHGVLDTTAFGIDAAVKLWSGRDDDALSVVDLREIAAAYPPRLSLMLSCYLIQRYLRLGRSEEAIVEAAQIGLLGDRPYRATSAVDRALVAATEIELHISAGRLKQATVMIAEEKFQARNQGRYGRLVELALDEAAIAMCSHNPTPAVRHLTRAVGIAAKRRYLRPFRDRAELIAGLVNETKSKDWGFAVEGERRFFAEICNGLPSANAALLDQLVELGEGIPALSETPTPRELELLSLVEVGMSNQQMADRLSVSVATVKWHLYNLYTKLGISNRAAALARARALNLLSR